MAYDNIAQFSVKSSAITPCVVVNGFDADTSLLTECGGRRTSPMRAIKNPLKRETGQTKKRTGTVDPYRWR